MASKKTTITKPTLLQIQSLSFHERFEIETGVAQAKQHFITKQHFINRALNYIFENYLDNLDHKVETQIRWRVANALGERYKTYLRFEDYIKSDFHRCLRALEVSYDALSNRTQKSTLNHLVKLILSETEADLGIAWKPPVFVRTGARLLDTHLVNEPLRWLADKKYSTVYLPFRKGLSHFLESEKKPQLLPDVITDMYESVEALSKVITSRPNKDLSANAELFIKSIKASEYYKLILKEYISYANQFRHAANQEKPKPSISISEAESFIYLTGLFIRLAIQVGSQ